MPTKSLQLTLPRICLTIVLAALTIPLAASGQPNPQNQSDWKQWSEHDVRRILTHSPWVSTCCQAWAAGGESEPPGLGATAVIVSSQTVREALVRQMQLEKRYAQLDPARRREIDQRIDACLNKKFDSDIVISFSSLGNWKRSSSDVVKGTADGIRVITSDGRKVAGHLISESMAMTCGAFPEDHLD